MLKRLLTVLVAICAGQSASAVSLASASVRADAIWSVTPQGAPFWPYLGEIPHESRGDSFGGKFVGAGPAWGAAYDHNYSEAADRFSIFAESAAAADTGSATGTYAYAAAKTVWSGPAAVEELNLTITYDIAADVSTSGRPREISEAMVDFSLKLVLESMDMLAPVVLGNVAFSQKVDEMDLMWSSPVGPSFRVSHSFSYVLDLRGPWGPVGTPGLPGGVSRKTDVLTLEMSAQVQTYAAVVAPVPVPPALPMAVGGLGLLAAVRRWGRSDRLHPAMG